MATPMPVITLPSGDEIPVLGQGTWHLAEVPARRNQEIAALDQEFPPPLRAQPLEMV